MKNILKYSVLRYIPHIDSGETINLGFLVSDKEKKYKEFCCTSNFNRIKFFDDEINIYNLKGYLESIVKDVEEVNYDKFSIDSYVKFYINSFCFSDVLSLEYDDLRKVILSLKKLYLRYDFDKKNRSTKKEDKALLMKIVKDNYNEDILDNKVVGKYNENITYDIVTNDFCVKFFEMTGKNISNFINYAKIWKFNGDNELRKTYVVYRYDEMNNSKFSIIRNIFNDSKTKFIGMSEFDSVLKNQNISS